IHPSHPKYGDIRYLKVLLDSSSTHILKDLTHDHLIKPSFKTSKPRIESYEIPSEIPHCLVPYVLRQRVVYSSHK
ncbi:hypothetical protein ACQKJL_18765, partial [Bacillus altitudinis]